MRLRLRMTPDLWPGCQTFGCGKFVLKSGVSPFTHYKVSAWARGIVMSVVVRPMNEVRPPLRGTRLVLRWMTVLGQLYYHFSMFYLSGIGSPG